MSEAVKPRPASRAKRMLVTFSGRGDPSQEQTTAALKALARFKAAEVLPGTLQLRANPDRVRVLMSQLHDWKLSEAKTFMVPTPSPALAVSKKVRDTKSGEAAG